jgi:hypothetical protein
MQAKYVPRFASKTPSQEQHASQPKPVTEAPLSQSNRWAPLVNTSLPAKQAPILPPSTLASLTKVSIKLGKQAPPSADDFPTLGGPKAAPKAPALPKSNRPTFSQLSKEWAVKKEEDDKKAKEDAEKAASEERHLRAAKEKDDALARDIRKLGFVSLPPTKRIQLIEPERVCSFSDEEDEIDPFDNGVPEEEEEEEETDDTLWNARKSRHDLY